LNRWLCGFAMKDGTFTRRLRQLVAAKKRYLAELSACEDEYKRRFGEYPSDWDDDQWIDFAHVSGEAEIPTLGEINVNALQCRRMSTT